MMDFLSKETAKPPKYSYDEECERLARLFLTDEPGATETSIRDLAQFIQDNIESWIAQMPVGEPD